MGGDSFVCLVMPPLLFPPNMLTVYYPIIVPLQEERSLLQFYRITVPAMPKVYG